jgi:hypothetical protein
VRASRFALPPETLEREDVLEPDASRRAGCSGSATALQRLDRGLPCQKDGSKGHGPSRVGMASANSQRRDENRSRCSRDT